MTVAQLISELEGFDEDMEVVMGGVNSMYADSIDYGYTTELRSFWGSDRNVLVLKAGSQLGAVDND